MLAAFDATVGQMRDTVLPALGGSSDVAAWSGPASDRRRAGRVRSPGRSHPVPRAVRRRCAASARAAELPGSSCPASASCPSAPRRSRPTRRPAGAETQRALRCGSSHCSSMDGGQARSDRARFVDYCTASSSPSSAGSDFDPVSVPGGPHQER